MDNINNENQLKGAIVTLDSKIGECEMQYQILNEFFSKRGLS